MSGRATQLRSQAAAQITRSRYDSGSWFGPLTLDLGRFDVVTAFGALHHLPENLLRDVVSRAARMSTALIFQACDVIDSLPSTTLNLHRLMRDHGYEVQVHPWPARADRCW